MKCALSSPGPCPPVGKKSMSANGCTTRNDGMKAHKGTDKELRDRGIFWLEVGGVRTGEMSVPLVSGGLEHAGWCQGFITYPESLAPG